MKKRKIHLRSNKTGLPPGSLIYVGDRPASQVHLAFIRYNAQDHKEGEVQKLSDLTFSQEENLNTWLDVDGLHDPEGIAAIGAIFKIHGLVLEDIVNTEQRPKVEVMDDHLFLTLKMITDCPLDSSVLVMEQVSILLGKNYLITFQEQPGDLFDPVRERLKNAASLLRQNGPDFLMYRLLDIIVDCYLLILERLSEELDDIEEQMENGLEDHPVNRLQMRKRQLAQMRRVVAPLREAVFNLLRDDTNKISSFTQHYLTDISDHLVQVMDMLDSLRDISIELRETHLALLSHRTNESMKWLTIIATIFIPLTFLVGVYGMNFRYMPELEWRYGYAMIWIVILIIALMMIRYFYRKRLL